MMALRAWSGRAAAACMPALLAGCVAAGADRQAWAPVRPAPRSASTIELALTVMPGERVTAAYTLRPPAKALHFAQALGGYRARSWAADPAYRWVAVGDGERIERRDGADFDRLAFIIPVDYQALPKGYAPFSPFSEGSALIHTGQFHACTHAPCDGAGPLPIAIRADGRTIGAFGRRTPDRARMISDDDGTNIFVGTLAPVAIDGFVAIIDPGLPPQLRRHLDRSLPQAMRDLAAIYGLLPGRPELYVSIDARPEPGGHTSTQGGTLRNQIFMHFDGAGARERVAQDTPYWLDWFFAHEAAHLFQQSGVGALAGDDAAAWIHEGGADAMAALALADRGVAERSYVQTRMRDAEGACAAGLSHTPLGQASARDAFDLHYQCGLLIWLALDRELRSAGHDGLHALNRRFFADVRGGAAWDTEQVLRAAAELDVGQPLLDTIREIELGSYPDATAAIGRLGGSPLPQTDEDGRATMPEPAADVIRPRAPAKRAEPD